MNVFLLGNGFDLHHKFPTHYYDFLQTIAFLIENYDETYETVGKVFGDTSLQEKDEFIKRCYDQHESIYNRTSLTKEEMESLISRAKNNMWYEYLYNCVGTDITWIDFEKEISRVLEAISAFFNYEDKFELRGDNKVIYNASIFPADKEDRYILSKFDFFYEESEYKYIGQTKIMQLKAEFVNERIAGSKAYYPLIDKIASVLYASLQELAEILRDYLRCFVDNPAKEYRNLGIRPRFPDLPTPNRVYSFNYTNTIEYLYKNSMVDHIHGDTNQQIVLGVNPDKDDQLYSVDTTFLQFKKYFQRTFYNTDLDFLKHMQSKKIISKAYSEELYVIGHSLDVTDEDMITQIFSATKEINVLYYDEDAVKNQINNLVKIYGKEGLDKLREEKYLKFIPQEEVRWEYPEVG